MKTIGRYELVSVLGKGGCGTVYKAFDPVLERHVALKVIRPADMGLKGTLDDQRSQCLNEARLSARFIHPNIAVTHDAGFENDLVFMAMECIDGEGLNTRLQPDGLLPRLQVLEILYGICFALEYIHSQGYAHLDIKPSNIMITNQGEAKLMDFGIARLLQEGDRSKPSLSGSLHYMSPEQTNPGSDLSCASDIFSLGVVAYQVLSGRKPFEGDDAFQILYQILHHDPPGLHVHKPEIPADLDAVIQKAIRKNPDERHASAKAFAEALLPFIKGKDSVHIDKQARKKIDYMKRLILFRHFELKDLEELLRISSWSLYPQQAWITGEGENDRNIYILILGKAAIHLDREIKILKPGDCFGESALINNMPRKARLKAETDCVVMAMNANILNQADAGIQAKFLREFFINKTIQLVEANLKLIQCGLR